MARGLARAALDIPFGFAIGLVVASVTGLSVGLAVTFVLAIPLLWLTFTVAEQLGRFERARAAALLDVELAAPHPPLRSSTWGGRLRERLGTGSRWRELLYLVVGIPFQGALGFVVLGTWTISIILVALPTYIGHTAGDTVGVGPLQVQGLGDALGGMALGLVGLAVLAPRLTVGLVDVDRAVVRLLLGPRRGDELERRVGELEVSRGAALDQAEAERRRIERDLHDGAQQRLVALAMDLSRARERFDADPARARQLLESAHEEAKAALVELRNLARGVHPAVLAERGLDAALASVVARCPLPVSLSVDIMDRPPPTVESAAYFVVAESLTNVAKHAEAGAVAVVVALQERRLLIEVRDDGRGGARVAPGGGLGGLSDRVTALGGWMRVLSPPGGPTSVLVELPCGS
ncbi:MAG: sensor histidine kinase [Acidimicrobiales bacterium]